VTDITLRVGVGGVLVSAFNQFPNNQLGDEGERERCGLSLVFPYLSDCPDGRNRRHVDPGEAGGGPVK
jgi:hypothetical protein